MMRTLFFAMAFAACSFVGVAQEAFAPVMGAYQYSNGVHPVVTAVFPNADLRTVQRFWKDQLRSISTKVLDKKELIGEAARIPSASSDTMRILIQSEQGRGAQDVMTHIAFHTNIGYVAPDSPERELKGCTEWVRSNSVALLKQVAQKNLDLGQRDLDREQRKLNDLQRDLQRTEGNLRITEQRGELARIEKAEMDSLLSLPTMPIKTATDSVAATDELKQLAKERGKQEDRSKRADRTAASMAKKAEDLRWSIKTNKEDQVKQEEVVAKQQEVVNGLKRDLDTIR